MEVAQLLNRHASHLHCFNNISISLSALLSMLGPEVWPALGNFRIFIVTIISVSVVLNMYLSLMIARDKLIGTDPPGVSQRKVSGDESLASILLMRSLEASCLLLPSPLAVPPKLARQYTHMHSFSLINDRIKVLPTLTYFLTYFHLIKLLR